jgi:hypothetical protein
MTLHTLHLGNNDPDSDEVVGETGKEGLAIGGPGERGALWLLGLFGELGREIGFEVINNGPGCQFGSRSEDRDLLGL